MKQSVTICAILFCVLLFGMAITFWLVPKKDFSAVEKRALQTRPKPDMASLLSGSYTDRLAAFYADQFPLRASWVGLKGRAEILLGKGENNGILLGSGGRLARRRFRMLTPEGAVGDVDFISQAQVTAACDGILRAQEALSVPFAVLLTGRNVDVCPSAFSYPTDFSDALNETVQSRLRGKVAAPDLISLFRSGGEGLYYRTDHHWTTAGAYLGYCAAMEALGQESAILPSSEFRREVVSSSFYGTLWAAGGMEWVSPDSVEVWYRGNEADFTVVADGRALGGFYAFSRMESGDTYALFLDGTHDVVTIRKSGEARPCLLVIRDSFASSLAPFLAQHYDLVLLNLSSVRSDFTAVSALASEYGADAVLLVYTLENLLTADKLPRLR
ncbi:MAG TPA: hypothetical protein DDW30_06810 [Clostridiales bacterium]|nr:hypothetical protein [Clostridiales bacterium]